MAKAKKMAAKKTTVADERAPAVPAETVAPSPVSLPMSAQPAAAVEGHRPAPIRVRPSAEEISRRAYEKYRARNGRPGSALEDWTSAERELRGTSA